MTFKFYVDNMLIASWDDLVNLKLLLGSEFDMK